MAEPREPDGGTALAGTAYRTAPLLLNLERDVAGKWSLASTWCNLGLWPQPSFREACSALARMLGTAVGLSASDATVLDCGVGYGDQVALWSTEFGARHVIALEISQAHADAASERLSRQRLPGTAEVHAASAVDMPTDVLSRAAGCDVVLCLDCAYHFDTRQRFISTAAALLRPGGRFGAVDMLPLDHGRWGWRRLAQLFVAAACGIPRANLHGPEEYAVQLRRAGLSEVTFSSVGAKVFGPFAANAVAQRDALGGSISWGEWGFLTAVGGLMGAIARYRLFDAVLVTATRPREPTEGQIT